MSELSAITLDSSFSYTNSLAVRLISERQCFMILHETFCSPYA
jgi:hypothetical protein